MAVVLRGQTAFFLLYWVGEKSYMQKKKKKSGFFPTQYKRKKAVWPCKTIAISSLDFFTFLHVTFFPNPIQKKKSGLATRD